jgi:hypothetical protein
MGPRERERERLRESSNDRDFAEYSKSCGVLADSIVPLLLLLLLLLCGICQVV